MKEKGLYPVKKTIKIILLKVQVSRDLKLQWGSMLVARKKNILSIFEMSITSTYSTLYIDSSPTKWNIENQWSKENPQIIIYKTLQYYPSINDENHIFFFYISCALKPLTKFSKLLSMHSIIGLSTLVQIPQKEEKQQHTYSVKLEEHNLIHKGPYDNPYR